MTNDSPEYRRNSQRDPWGIGTVYLTVGEIVAYVLAVLTIVVLGADRFFLIAVFCLEICVYLASRTIKLAYCPGGTARLVAVCALIFSPAFSIAAFATLFFGIRSLSDQSHGGQVVGALALCGAAIGIVADRVSIFRKRTLKLLSLQHHINEKYMLEGQPSRQLITPVNSCTGCVVEGYAPVVLYGLIAWMGAGIFFGGNSTGGAGDVLVALVLVLVRLGVSCFFAAAVYAYYGRSNREEQVQRYLKGLSQSLGKVVRRPQDRQLSAPEQEAEGGT